MKECKDCRWLEGDTLIPDPPWCLHPKGPSSGCSTTAARRDYGHCGAEARNFFSLAVFDKGRAIFNEIMLERERQNAKFGEQHYPSSQGGWGLPRAHGLPTQHEAKVRVEALYRANKLAWPDIALEEFCEAIEEPDKDKRRAELVQLAAVIFAWIEDL